MAKRKNENEGTEAPVASTQPEQTPEHAKAKHAAKVAEHGITLVPTKFKSLGLDLTVNVPSSVEDFDKLAGRDGEALDQAVKNVVYRGALADFRYLLCEKIEAKTGVARAADYEKNEDGSDKVDDKGEKVFLKYSESEARYIKRVAGDNPGQFQELANEVAAGLIFDPSYTAPSERGPKKLAKVYTELAQALIDQGRGDAVAEKLTAKLGYTVTADHQSLAAAIKDDQSRKSLAAEYAS